MNELAIKMVGAILITVVFLPFTYIYYFLIWQLPKRYSFGKRWSIVCGYLFILFLDTYLLSEGFIGLFLFILVPLAVQFGGAYYFRQALKEDLQRMWWKLKNE